MGMESNALENLTMVAFNQKKSGILIAYKESQDKNNTALVRFGQDDSQESLNALEAILKEGNILQQSLYQQLLDLESQAVTEGLWASQYKA